MLRKRSHLTVLILFVFTTLFAMTIVRADTGAALADSTAYAAVMSAAKAKKQCYYGSKVWADGKSYGIHIWREWLEFDWCHDGKTVNISKVRHWFEIKYPNTNVKWKNQSVSNGPNGSKIIFVQGDLEFCIGPICLHKYSAIKLKIAKNGSVTKLS